MTKEWSSYQKDIFRSVNKGAGHLIIEALAGSGKTTTLVESFKYIPKNKKVVALAFNKIIKQELANRATPRVECLTFHSLGLRSIKQRFKTVEIDDYKVFNIVKDLLDSKTEWNLISNICDTIAFCKYNLVDSPSAIEEIILEYGIDLCEMPMDEFIKIVIKALAKDKEQVNKIDFNDMCYFPFIYDLPLGKYDYVYVDEYQDANRSQIFMARKVCNPTGGRMIIAGDKKQDLYSWRGSDTSIVNDLKNDPTTRTLTLPITYRCPKKVVELVKPWVPNFECQEIAKEGTIEEISMNEMYKTAKPGCFILSRVNAPLIRICMTFIKNGVRCNIRGRDVGKQLNSIIKKSKKKQIPAFLKWLDKWKDDEVAKLIAKGIKTDVVLDKYECLINLCEDANSLEDVKKTIDEMFDDSDEKNIIILSSIHKSKGLERDAVFLLQWTCRGWFNEIIEGDEQYENENMNINYVACTRSKNNLYLVNKI